jgi:hypothetical protein
MLRSRLSGLFVGAVAKRLTLVETVTVKSNQHEIQGVRPIRSLLGDDDRRTIPTRFIRMAGENTSFAEDGFMSWSNVRKNKPRSAEYHLYYSGNLVTESMAVGDLMVIALRRDGTLLAIVAPSGSSSESQLLWLFDLENPAAGGVSGHPIDEKHDADLGLAARYVLDELGIEVEELEQDRLDALIDEFGLVFPSTKVFSALARQSLPDVSAEDDPDQALLDWIDREEQLFRRLERRVVEERIRQGFTAADGADVEGFLAFSLSVQNRRKARAGQALEHHLQAVFEAQKIAFVRGAETENRNKPDFLFPSVEAYCNQSFPAQNLSMLGSKSTLKDRWRQVLSEAERIPDKHLLTLEPAVSENQTDEMRAKQLQLVVPRRLHETYRPSQQAWLMDLKSFIQLVEDRARMI